MDRRFLSCARCNACGQRLRAAPVAYQFKAGVHISPTVEACPRCRPRAEHCASCGQDHLSTVELEHWLEAAGMWRTWGRAHVEAAVAAIVPVDEPQPRLRRPG